MKKGLIMGIRKINQCEIIGQDGARCTRRVGFSAHVYTVPQVLADDRLEGLNAGRSNLCCAQHLPGLVRTLQALSIRRVGAEVTVHPYEI